MTFKATVRLRLFCRAQINDRPDRRAQFPPAIRSRRILPPAVRDALALGRRTCWFIHAAGASPLLRGYNFLGEQIKATFEEATGATSFPGASAGISAPHFEQTLSALIIVREPSLALPFFYCVKFYQRLCPDHGNQMAQFVLDVAGHGDRVGNLLSQ